MDGIELAPYIFFKGDCMAAMAFYKAIFGGDLTLTKYDDMPDDFPDKDQMSGKIMNAALEGGSITIRGCDMMRASEAAKKVELCLTGSDEAELRQIFDGLCEDAKTSRPLKKEFWGDYFGTVTDKFGVDWMVDITAQK